MLDPQLVQPQPHPPYAGPMLVRFQVQALVGPNIIETGTDS
ncbi:hypothetical protein AB0I10_35950 [Streptomyces sp. NPDC050636]